MHTIVPFVGLFSVDKGVLVNLFFVLCLIATNGGCGELVAFLVGGLGLYGFFNYLNNGARIRIYLKLLLKTARGSITAAVVFFALLFLTGRGAGSFDMRALWTHVQIYLAGPVPLLEYFLQAPLFGGGDIFSKETFYAINSQLIKLGLPDIPLYSPHLEFFQGCIGAETATRRIARICMTLAMRGPYSASCAFSF